MTSFSDEYGMIEKVNMKTHVQKIVIIDFFKYIISIEKIFFGQGGV